MISKIKKILITQYYSPLAGIGMSVNTLSLSKKLQRAGFEVVVASPRMQEDTIQEGVLLATMPTLQDLEALVKEADLVIPTVNFSKRTELLGISVLKTCAKQGKPAIPWVRTTRRNLLFANTDSDLDLPMFELLLKEALTLPVVIKTVCNSSATRDSLVNLGINGSKLTVINNSIDKEVVQSIPKSSEKAFDVLFVSRLTPEKGVPFFLGAAKLMVENMSNIKICVVGNGADKNELLNLAEALSVKPNITFVDKVENTKLLELMAESKVVVNSSLTESFGMTILEAMALGTPVVVPNIEGPVELTRNGRLGEVFNLGNTQELAEKVLQVLNSPEKAAKKARAAKEFVFKNLTTDIQAQKFISLLQNQGTLIPAQIHNNPLAKLTSALS